MLTLGVLISGGGTTLKNLLEVHRRGELPVEFRCVISSSASAGGLRFAQEAAIPSHVFERRAFRSAEAFSEAYFTQLRQADVSLVVMAGFLKHLPIPDDFAQRVINIHPSLIPAFCGAGMYGKHVHQAVLDYGAKISGCTVHFVDNEYDHGPIILQRTVPVRDDDSAEQLAARVFEQECVALPEAIRALAFGRIAIVGRRVRMVSA